MQISGSQLHKMFAAAASSIKFTSAPDDDSCDNALCAMLCGRCTVQLSTITSSNLPWQCSKFDSPFACALAYTEKATTSATKGDIFANVVTIMQHLLKDWHYGHCVKLLETCPARHQVTFGCALQQQKTQFNEIDLIGCLGFCKLQFSADLICSLFTATLSKNCLLALITALGGAIYSNATHRIHAVDTLLKKNSCPKDVCNLLGQSVTDTAVAAFSSHNGTYASAEVFAYWLQAKFIPSSNCWRMPMPSAHRAFVRRLIKHKCTALLFYLLRQLRCEPAVLHLPLNATASDAVFATLSTAHLAKLQQEADDCIVTALPLSSASCTRKTCVYNLILRAAKSSSVFTAQKTIDFMCARVAKFGSHGFTQHCKHGCHFSNENSPLLYAHVLSLNPSARTASKMRNISQQLYQMAAKHNAIPSIMLVHRKPFFNICKNITLAILDNSIREICNQTTIMYSTQATFEIHNKLMHCIHRYEINNPIHEARRHLAWQWMVENFTVKDKWNFNAVMETDLNVSSMIVSACVHYAMTKPNSARNVWHDLAANNRLVYVFDTEFTADAEAAFFSEVNVQEAQQLACSFFKACYQIDVRRRQLRAQLNVCFKGIRTVQSPFRQLCGLPAILGFYAGKTPSWMHAKEMKEAFCLYLCMYRRLAQRQSILCEEMLRLVCNFL